MFYRVIAEPDTVDAQGDVMSAETVEEMAHNFLLRSAGPTTGRALES